MAFNEFQAVFGELVRKEDSVKDHVPAVVPALPGDAGEGVLHVSHQELT